MLNSNNKNNSYQHCIAWGLCLGFVFGAIINNLGIGLIMGISLSLLLNKVYFKSR